MKRRTILRIGVGAFVAGGIAIVATLMLGRFSARVGRLYEYEWRRDVGMLHRALDEYASGHAGVYPASLAELERARPDLRQFGVFDDPWKSPYVYVAPTEGGVPPVVFSCGPDQRARTADDRLDSDADTHVDD